MLESIAQEARRWTAGLPVEIALVFPVVLGKPSAPVAIEYGTRDCVAMTVERVLRTSLAAGAEAVVIAHNHPGEGEPSAADFALTRRLVAAGATIGVRLHAHIILTAQGWYDCAAPRVALHSWPNSAAA